LQLAAETRAVAGTFARAAGAIDVAAQSLELAMQADRHLLAQLVAQALQLARDAAGDGEAVLLPAHAFDVVHERLIAARGGCGGLARRPTLALVRKCALGSRIAQQAVATRLGVGTAALQPLLERGQRLVDLVEGRGVPVLTRRSRCVEIGPSVAHRDARFP